MVLHKLSTGVPELDTVLGGGLPEYSFNILAGMPGTGKTTLAHHFLFANATPENPAFYFTVLGEPTLKMLDPALRVRSANRAFYQTFQVTPTETKGCLIYEIGNGQ